MENPDSQTPKHGKNPGGISDVQDFVLSFESLGLSRLSRYGTLGQEEYTTSQSNNASSPCSTSYTIFSSHTPKEDAANSTNSKKIKNQCDVAQENSDKTQWFLENPVSDHGSIWGYQFFATEGEDFASNVHNNGQESLRGFKDYQDCYFDLWKPENFAAGSSSRQPRTESFCCCPSTSNCVSQFKGSPLFHEDPRFRPTAIYNFENYQFRERKNNGLHSGGDYAATNNDQTSSYNWIHQGSETFAEGQLQFDLVFLQEILEKGDYEQIDMLFFMFQGSYLTLMIDKNMCIVFQKLVDVCRGEQLNALVAEVLSWSQLFTNAAFCRQGASSIVRLIKKLKKSNHAFRVTNVLSTRFLAIMTHDIARVVIQQCFIYFGNEPNKILYEKAILYFQVLAIDKVGCRSLNDIINTIAGEQRSRLLNHIADCSAYLSNDPYGNYVVQNVLSLKKRDVTARIVLSLRGQFVQLAKKTGGSNVVEKCMESSDFGTVSVVQEILENRKASFRLAQDQFGNYVIQTALKKTKEHGFSDLYDSLVKSLQPYCEELNQTIGGKNVLNLLTDDAQLKWQNSIDGRDSAMWWWMVGR